MYEICATLFIFLIGYTYVATYICKAMYDNANIQLQLQKYCLPLTCVCMQFAHYMRVLKEGFSLDTDKAA